MLNKQLDPLPKSYTLRQGFILICSLQGLGNE